MNVNLGSTFDKFVTDLVGSGLYQSQSEVLREGLRLLKEREDIRSARLDEMRVAIREGIIQAERGEWVDGKKAFARLRARSRTRRKSTDEA